MAEGIGQAQADWDVVVVGGGIAGLCAAIAASDSGARTLLVEASTTLGGTASWSGGTLWVPANRRLLSAGGQDSQQQAREYVRACLGDQADEPAVQAYIAQADDIIAWLESNTPLELEVGTMPDYQGDMPGGYYEAGKSRSLAPAVFDLNRLGTHRDLLRRSPFGTMPFGFREFSEMGGVLHPERIDAALFQQRLEAGYVGWGEALAGALVLGVLEHPVTCRMASRVRHCARTPEGFTLAVEQAAATREETEQTEVRCRALVLACGGYEWDTELLTENFPGVDFVPSTVPYNRGDAWHMAEKLGARIDNRGKCWGWPGYLIPGENLEEGTPMVRTGLFERTLPHMIMVNARGERFVDESLPYHVILKALIARDEDGTCINQPAFHVFDGQYREKYSFGPVTPGTPLPPWIIAADTVAGLAQRAGIDAAGLAATLDRFNHDVEQERGDTAFARGEHPYGRFWGDDTNPAGPNLGTLRKPPFHAVPVIPSLIGTCGGPRIDAQGRVTGEDGAVIPGLYAAGNATAAVSGHSYFGPGGTIGPAMVFGVLAGRTAAEESSGNAQ